MLILIEKFHSILSFFYVYIHRDTATYLEREYMTKAEIAQKVNDISNITLKESIEIVESVLDIVKETLENGETVKISGFGSFIVKQKHARRGRNPQTGESITLDARRVLTFKPSNLLRDAINS